MSAIGSKISTCAEVAYLSNMFHARSAYVGQEIENCTARFEDNALQRLARSRKQSRHIPIR